CRPKSSPPCTGCSRKRSPTSASTPSGPRGWRPTCAATTRPWCCACSTTAPTPTPGWPAPAAASAWSAWPNSSKPSPAGSPPGPPPRAPGRSSPSSLCTENSGPDPVHVVALSRGERRADGLPQRRRPPQQLLRPPVPPLPAGAHGQAQLGVLLGGLVRLLDG